jgi:hypothetical protein
MRSRAIRLTISATIWLAIAAVGFFVVRSQRQIEHRETRVNTFTRQAQEIVDVLARARSAQQAYLVEGQSTAFWTGEVTSLLETGSAGIEALHASASAADSPSLLDDAKARLAGFADVDARAREYLESHQLFMASDVVFAEGAEAASQSARQLQAASLQERQAFDRFEAGQRRLQAIALGGLAALVAVALAALAFAAGASRPAATAGDSLSIAGTPPTPDAGLIALREAATICTEFARAGGADALAASLGKAAVALQARGLVAWIADEAGGDLRPLVAHGYSAHVLARMPVIPRSADNAAAAAYRTGRVQVVSPSDGTSSGAVISPLLTPDGCVGALTAEVAGGEEASQYVQALAAIFAAQLSTLVSPAPAAGDATTAQTATA